MEATTISAFSYEVWIPLHFTRTSIQRDVVPGSSLMYRLMSRPSPQMTCTSGFATCRHVPPTIQCYNRGMDGLDVQVRALFRAHSVVGVQGADGEWLFPWQNRSVLRRIRLSRYE